MSKFLSKRKGNCRKNVVIMISPQCSDNKSGLIVQFIITTNQRLQPVVFKALA